MQGGLGVVTKGKEVFLFYRISNKKTSSLHIAKSKDGHNFILGKQKITIINQTGKAEIANNCSDFSFTHDGQNFVMYYRLLLRSKYYYCRAVSKTLLKWQVKEKTISAPEMGIIVPNYNFKKQLVRYSGKTSVYIGFLNKTKKTAAWENASAPVLEPRADFFDGASLEINNAISLPEGILLTYHSKHPQRGHDSYTIGAALFDKKDPTKVLWRAPAPIWTQREDWNHKNIKPLGACAFKGDIIFYFRDKTGEIFSVLWTSNDYLKSLIQGKFSSRVTRHASNPIITPNQKNWWESKAAMNAAAIYEDGRIHLLYRAIGDTDISVIGYAGSQDGINFDQRIMHPVYVPREKFEGVNSAHSDHSLFAAYDSGGGNAGGCEDPRLTKIGDTIYMTYVAYNGYTVPGVAITSIRLEDFLNKKWYWKKPRLISKPGQIQKNWMLFPEKINGKYAMLHSITPNILIDYFDDLEVDNILIEKSFRMTDTNEKCWDNIVRGAGAPPIKTKHGWLLFYHAMDKRDPNRYKIGAMILDLDNPEKILHRSQHPILEPDERYENEGFKSGVVYMCGAVVVDETLFIYYGGADTVMCVATAKLDEFIDQLVSKHNIKVSEVKILK